MFVKCQNAFSCPPNSSPPPHQLSTWLGPRNPTGMAASPTAEQWRLGRQRGAQALRAWQSCTCPATQLPKAKIQSPPAQLCTPEACTTLNKNVISFWAHHAVRSTRGHTKAHGVQHSNNGAEYTACFSSLCSCVGSSRPPVSIVPRRSWSQGCSKLGPCGSPKKELCLLTGGLPE